MTNSVLGPMAQKDGLHARAPEFTAYALKLSPTPRMSTLKGGLSPWSLQHCLDPRGVSMKMRLMKHEEPYMKKVAFFFFFEATERLPRAIPKKDSNLALSSGTMCGSM